MHSRVCRHVHVPFCLSRQWQSTNRHVTKHMTRWCEHESVRSCQCGQPEQTELWEREKHRQNLCKGVCVCMQVRSICYLHHVTVSIATNTGHVTQQVGIAQSERMLVEWLWESDERGWPPDANWPSPILGSLRALVYWPAKINMQPTAGVLIIKYQKLKKKKARQPRLQS